jgi:hypothetical protein
VKLKLAIITVLLGAALAVPSCTPPSWVGEAESIAKVSLPIVEGVATIVGAGPAVTQVVNDINLLITLFESYQAEPAATTLQKIQAGLATVQADLNQIMPAAGIKDPATESKVTAILQLVSSEFQQIASLLPSPGTAPAAPQTAQRKAQTSSGPSSTPAAGLSVKDFKKQYHDIVKGDPRFPKV